MTNQVVFTHLFAPLDNGKFKLKNRIVMLPMDLHYASNGEFDDRAIEFLAARARGGAGLIITGILGIDDYATSKNTARIDDDHFIPRMRRLTRAVHEADGKIAAQLGHGGRNVRPEQIGGRQPLSPSALAPAHSGDTPKEMTKEEIKTTIEHFAQAARRAKTAGFDAVEILGSTGGLVNQFLSPVSNQRGDEYGGSFENRLRFPLEVIKAVREEVGEDYPVMIRLCASEFVPGGLTIEDTKEVARVYEQAGIDILNLQVAWHESAVPTTYMTVPHGVFTYLAQAIKKAVNIPVVAVNRINDPFLAEEILREGKADLIGMARALIADPELPNKARENRCDDICPCVGCSEGCMAWSGNERLPVRCLTNTRAGREKELPVLQFAPKRKKVVVVGGGPAGLEASRILSQRGHKVVLYEKDRLLGGELRLAGLVPGKSEFANYISYLERQLRKQGVNIRLGKEATPEAVLKEKPQAVIIATGASPVAPPIPGIKSPKVSSYREVLDGKELGQKVVVIGAGGVGCDMAIYAARRGAPDAEALLYLLRAGAIDGKQAVSLDRGGRQVTLIDVLDKIGQGISRGVRWVVLQELRQLGVEMLASANCREVTGEGVVVVHHGKERLIEADSIVVATGVKSENTLYPALKEEIAEVYLVGNAREARDALAATDEAATIAYQV